VLNGIISPLMIFFIVHLSGDKKIMGDFKNKKIGNILGWLTFILVALVGIGTIITLLV
jgi:Mn2+/Fe2+ NRAMP family transporter